MVFRIRPLETTSSNRVLCCSVTLHTFTSSLSPSLCPSAVVFSLWTPLKLFVERSNGMLDVSQPFRGLFYLLKLPVLNPSSLSNIANICFAGLFPFSLRFRTDPINRSLSWYSSYLCSWYYYYCSSIILGPIIFRKFLNLLHLLYLRNI